MRSKNSELRRTVGGVLIPAMLVWISGACFMSCCAATAASADSSYGSSAGVFDYGDADSCPSAQGHDCCRTDGKIHGIVSYTHRLDGDGLKRCCIRAAQYAELARKSRGIPERAASHATNGAEIAGLRSERTPERVYRARLPDKGGIYLRVCLFLI